MSVRQVARRFGVSPNAIYMARHDGRLPPVDGKPPRPAPKRGKFAEREPEAPREPELRDAVERVADAAERLARELEGK